LSTELHQDFFPSLESMKPFPPHSFVASCCLHTIGALLCVFTPPVESPPQRSTVITHWSCFCQSFSPLRVIYFSAQIHVPVVFLVVLKPPFSFKKLQRGFLKVKVPIPSFRNLSIQPRPFPLPLYFFPSGGTTLRIALRLEALQRVSICPLRGI